MGQTDPDSFEEFPMPGGEEARSVVRDIREQPKSYIRGRTKVVPLFGIGFLSGSFLISVLVLERSSHCHTCLMHSLHFGFLSAARWYCQGIAKTKNRWRQALHVLGGVGHSKHGAKIQHTT
jgi:hypothetical protein